MKASHLGSGYESRFLIGFRTCCSWSTICAKTADDILTVANRKADSVADHWPSASLNASMGSWQPPNGGSMLRGVVDRNPSSEVDPGHGPDDTNFPKGRPKWPSSENQPTRSPTGSHLPNRPHRHPTSGVHDLPQVSLAGPGILTGVFGFFRHDPHPCRKSPKTRSPCQTRVCVDMRTSTLRRP